MVLLRYELAMSPSRSDTRRGRRSSDGEEKRNQVQAMQKEQNKQTKNQYSFKQFKAFLLLLTSRIRSMAVISSWSVISSEHKKAHLIATVY